LPGLKEIASLAGVSIRTASRAMRGEGYVASATRAKIMKFATEIGYRPNRAAKSLKYQRSNEIVLVTWSLQDLHGMGEIDMEQIVGLESALHTAGQTLKLRSGQLPRKTNKLPSEILEELIYEKPLGVIFFPLSPAIMKTCFSELLKHQIPSVVMGCRFPPRGFDAVQLSLEQGIFESVSYLVKHKKHQKIAYMGSDKGRIRLNAYYKAMKSYNLTPMHIDVPRGNPEETFSIGTEMAARIAKMSPRPTAIQAYSDYTGRASGSLLIIVLPHILKGSKKF